MKRIFTLLCILLAAAPGFAQQLKGGAATASALYLKEVSHDFGGIPQGRPVTYTFEAVNKGHKPLVVNSVLASCGCTSPEWNSSPVAPGGITQIKVGFNAQADGKFSKTITINFNEDEVKTLTITGEVFPTPTTPAPLNTSLSILKQ